MQNYKLATWDLCLVQLSL